LSWSQSYEQPVHTVNIGYDFYLGRYEITQGQWQAAMGSNPAHDYNVGSNYPVYYVSWNDCRAFVTALNALVPGGGFRMPSEAEWEYACRAGTTTRFSFGDSTCDPSVCLSCDLSAYGWWCGNDGAPETPEFGTKIVGLKPANPFGLYDTHGNVNEWCQDWWHADYTGAPNDGTGWEADVGIWRVHRGGAWGSPARRCRSSNRDGLMPSLSNFYQGLRIARDL